jgi:hypothetical protein
MHFQCYTSYRLMDVGRANPAFSGPRPRARLVVISGGADLPGTYLVFLPSCLQMLTLLGFTKFSLRNGKCLIIYYVTQGAVMIIPEDTRNRGAITCRYKGICYLDPSQPSS